MKNRCTIPMWVAKAGYIVMSLVFCGAGVLFIAKPELSAVAISRALGAAMILFGLIKLVGYFSKIDFSRIRNILFGGLIFLVVFNLLAMFIPALSMFDRIACMIGIVIFMLYTAYDTQKIKAFYYGFQGDDAMLAKASIISALNLYLDFVNLFLYLLRFLGKKKN